MPDSKEYLFMLNKVTESLENFAHIFLATGSGTSYSEQQKAGLRLTTNHWMIVWILIFLSHLCLRFPPDIVVWVYDTFDKNFGIENIYKILEGEL